ncbi:zinc metallopeptidase [Anaerobium acetethylicum]|uniref:Neutral zinc metallopeptidase n=1 Tax=Anaerobium acetethylicum TaxID=1619234 RepID=A0A1D3TV95_9FIRM|nr:zinc metallopeptidase [Anaerobium acetethylicum]SCP98052.1 hypothetical protein SAMN05421730_101621 [Anaerobium acetethylicum]
MLNILGAYYNTGYMNYWDPTYILVIIGAVISLIASAKVKTTFAKYSKVRSKARMTGAEAAKRILNASGIYGVRIERVAGSLTDHYDPRDKVLRLSDAVYGDTSVAAIGVAAHECGHAIQDEKGYAPLVLRSTLVPAANFGSKAAWPLIILGVVMGSLQPLIFIGILMFSISVLFTLVTLPVEFNASRRAIAVLGDTDILNREELKGTEKVLTAAALTYVASAAAAILSLLRLILIFGGRDRD